MTSVLAADNTRVRLGTEPAALTGPRGKVHVHYDAADYARRLQEAVLAARDAQEDETPQTEPAPPATTSPSPAPHRPSRPPQASRSPSCPSPPPTSPPPAESPRSAPRTSMFTPPSLPSSTLDLHVGSKGGLNPMPELKELRLVLSGTLDVEATLHGTGDIVGSCTLDLVDLAGGAAKIPLPALTFWVGPVPLVVTSEVLPVATARVDLGFEAASLTATAHGTASLSTG
ncbi:MAG: hypothetical protein R3B70_09950 [Polyangiaceae bacterium]